MPMVEATALRRLVYASRAIGADARRDREAILTTSQRNNGIDGISGILWTDGTRYVQLLEGPPESVASAFHRIARDARHTDIAVIEDGEQPGRLFGGWAMAGLPGEHPEEAASRLAMLLRNAPPGISEAFAAAPGER